MKSREKAIILTILTVLIFATVMPIGLTVSTNESEKPIVVCTTNVLGSIVKEIVDEDVEIVVLVNPGLCPADYDMKPSDIWAVSHAKALFYHDIPGEKPWLENLILASRNEDLLRVKVPGTYNTPEGAKRCIRIIGGNLSQILSKDLSPKITSMLNAIDSVANEIKNEAQSLSVENVNVICMKWQKPFVEWVGFKVVAVYNPPETLSAEDINSLINTARQNNVALIIDNLQVSAEFGESIASEVGAIHVVLTNFPGAIPGTENLTQMFQYNARQLFDGLIKWKIIKDLEDETENLKTQLTIFQATTFVAATIAVVELVLLLARRRAR